MSGRNKISPGIWEQIKVAHAAGIGLREVARNMNIPEGTVLSYAKRKGLTHEIATAKLATRPDLARQLARPDAINAITPMQSVAVTMLKRGQRHVERIAGISERVVDHVDAMPASEVLETIDQVEKLDRMARRTYGLTESPTPAGSLSVRVLTGDTSLEVVSE